MDIEQVNYALVGTWLNMARKATDPWKAVQVVRVVKLDVTMELEDEINDDGALVYVDGLEGPGCITQEAIDVAETRFFTTKEQAEADQNND